MRQRPDRYTFRAGQNLPDKEFRYLRTVIVTAAVHWGFSPYTSAYALAETCVFGKQSPGPIHCGRIAPPPLIPKLRGNFAEFLNHSYLAHLRILFLTTCVGSGYRFLYDKFRSFSWKHGFARLRCPRTPSSSRFIRIVSQIFLCTRLCA